MYIYRERERGEGARTHEGAGVDQQPTPCRRVHASGTRACVCTCAYVYARLDINENLFTHMSEMIHKDKTFILFTAVNKIQRACEHVVVF